MGKCHIASQDREDILSNEPRRCNWMGRPSDRPRPHAALTPPTMGVSRASVCRAVDDAVRKQREPNSSKSTLDRSLPTAPPDRGPPLRPSARPIEVHGADRCGSPFCVGVQKCKEAPRRPPADVQLQTGAFSQRLNSRSSSVARRGSRPPSPCHPRR